MTIFLCFIVAKLIACIVLQQIHFNRKERQLLDRIMARDFVEYRVTQNVASRAPRNLHRMTDEELAALEQSRKTTNGA